MNRTEALQTYRVAATGIDGLQVLAAPASAGPAAVVSVSVSLRLPHAAAQGLADGAPSPCRPGGRPVVRNPVACCGRVGRLG